MTITAGMAMMIAEETDFLMGTGGHASCNC